MGSLAVIGMGNREETIVERKGENIRRKGGNRRRKKRKESFSVHIYRVLKYVHPDVKISTFAMRVMNSFVNHLFEQIATEAGKLVNYNKKATITARDIQTTIRLLLPGELAEHACCEGNKAVVKNNLTWSNRYKCKQIVSLE